MSFKLAIVGQQCSVGGNITVLYVTWIYKAIFILLDDVKN